MELDVYRSCSRSEKRQVLHSFWRTSGPTTSRITSATLQYGPAAIGCLVVITVELAVIILLSLHRSPVLARITVGAEVLNVVALWWSLVRYRSLKAHSAH